MFLNNLEQKKIKIEITLQNRIITLERNVLKNLKNDDFVFIKNLGIHQYCVLEEMKYKDGRVLNFSNVKCNILVEDEEKLYIWENVKIFRVNLPSLGYVHLVTSNKKGNIINRRENYRVSLELDGLVKLENDIVKYDSFIKNISTNGIGIIIDSFINCKVGDDITIYFFDKEMDKYLNKEKPTEIILNANIVRINPINKNKNSIGCVFKFDNSNINKYVYTKQMLRRRFKH